MAKRLTREMADDAAYQLASIAFDKKIEQAKKEELEFGDYIVKTYIPIPIQGVMEEYRSWFMNLRTYVRCVDISGQNRNTLCVDTNVLIDAYLRAAQISHEDYKKASQLHNRCINLQQERDKYKSKVSDALVQLKSEKRIREAFPEALPYLNFSETTALIPQFDELRAMLKK